MVRLRDVRMGGNGRDGRSESGGDESVPGGAQQLLNGTGSDSELCSDEKSKFGKFGSNCGSAGSIAMDGGTLEEVMVMASAGPNGPARQSDPFGLRSWYPRAASANLATKGLLV